MFATVRAIEYHLPERVLTNEHLSQAFPAWSVDKIADKTGIVERRLAATGECASDLAFAAANKLFETGVCHRGEIDFLLLCTQSPDYLLPTTACLLQDRLGMPTSCGALDFNLGCSGFVYGLSLAKGLIETGQASKILLLTAETYSKFLHPDDRTVRPLFGDAAAATLIESSDEPEPAIGPFVFGTDGKGKENLILRNGGTRERPVPESDTSRSPDHLYMNGPEIFSFALQTVPRSVHALLERAGKKMDDIDRFVFHQANRFMLEHLRRQLKIPTERFVLEVSHVGNTVSSTIPIALREATARGEILRDELVMLVGFGVGYSWAATLMRCDLAVTAESAI